MLTRRLALRTLALAAALALAPPAIAPAVAKDAAFKSDRLGVSVTGSGPDVVLIPGLSSSPEVWEGTVKALPGYRYHLVHVAGFAGKAPGANAGGPVLAQIAEEIARYIKEAGLKQPALVGHSMGGTWAMMVAARHPGLASRVMVVDMLPFVGAMFGPPGTTPATIEPMAAQMRDAMNKASPEERRTRIEQTIATMVKTEPLRPPVVAQSLASDPGVGNQAFYELVITDLRPELAAIKVPMSVLYVRPPGAPITDEQMETFYKLSFATAPQTDLKRIPDSYHFIMFDQPEVFQRELAAFLKGQ